MPSDGKPRPWREIAEELQNERDPQRITELAHELTVALDAANIKPPHLPAAPKPPKPATGKTS